MILSVRSYTHYIGTHIQIFRGLLFVAFLSFSWPLSIVHTSMNFAWYLLSKFLIDPQGYRIPENIAAIAWKKENTAITCITFLSCTGRKCHGIKHVNCTISPIKKLSINQYRVEISIERTIKAKHINFSKHLLKHSLLFYIYMQALFFGRA